MDLWYVVFDEGKFPFYVSASSSSNNSDVSTSFSTSPLCVPNFSTASTQARSSTSQVVIPSAVSEPFMAAGEDSVVHVEPSNTVVQDPPVLVDLQTQVEVVGDFNDTSTQLSSPLERPQFRTDVHSPNSPVIHEPATQGEVSALEQVEIESVAHDEVMALEQVEIEPTIFAHIPNHVHNRHDSTSGH
ncbi:hypothetical protein V6N11_081040 [Hibiscus sabdariffa]|uniref:Uncharacterized protein n=1 Tax=Hibiscus sabdariffa TaxID=183260 RepID=A0ABR2QIR0_9ROSI